MSGNYEICQKKKQILKREIYIMSAFFVGFDQGKVKAMAGNLICPVCGNPGLRKYKLYQLACVRRYTILTIVIHRMAS